MEASEKISLVVAKIAGIAQSTKRKLIYFLLVSIVATAYLAWKLFSPESALWWNILKCGVVSIPLLVWAFIWSVLGQLEEAPELVSNLVSDEDGVFSNLQSLNFSEPNGLRGVFSSLREFREEDGLSVVFETISGVTLLANPLFAIVALLSLMSLSILILLSLFVMIF